MVFVDNRSRPAFECAHVQRWFKLADNIECKQVFSIGYMSEAAFLNHVLEVGL
jgi:hypothetical protein